jgi:hypothetical protein
MSGGYDSGWANIYHSNKNAKPAALRTTLPTQPRTIAQVSKSPRAASLRNSNSTSNKGPVTITTTETPQLATTRAARKNTNTTILINRKQAEPTASGPPLGVEEEIEAATASPAPTTISATRKTNSLSIRRVGCGKTRRSGSCGEARSVDLSLAVDVILSLSQYTRHTTTFTLERLSGRFLSWRAFVERVVALSLPACIRMGDAKVEAAFVT